MEKLAIFGGKPVRDKKIFYGHQYIDDKDIDRVVETLKSDFLTCGPKVKELENKLVEFTGAKYAVAVSNGTAALHCACIAADIKPGDEVIVTPLTFAASSNCVLYCGAKPVFVDVDINTYNIDPQKIEEKITNNTKAIIAVDYTGQVVEIEKIKEICKKHNLIFIEDAAHSIGSKYNNQNVGTLADMTCFSFHPVKTITSGEGGAILTNDFNLYQKLILAHTHGITHDIEENNDVGSWYYEQVSLGYNYRLTDFQSSLLLSQLDKIEWFIKRRKEIVEKYNSVFEKIPEVIVQNEIKESDTCRHIYIIRLNMDLLKCSRKEFYDAMNAENVQCQVHYIPIYWFPYYQKMGYEKGLCKNAEEIYNTSITIPLYPSMSDNDVNDVIKAVLKVIDWYRK